MSSNGYELTVVEGWLERMRQDHPDGADGLIGALAAFACESDHAPACPRGALDRGVSSLRVALPRAIPLRLRVEVDADQADLFGRRFQASLALLDGQPGPDGPLLATGLLLRCTQVLAGPPPVATRVRAVVDFYTTQAALSHHRHQPGAAGLPTLEELVEQAEWSHIDEQLSLARVDGLSRTGPVHLHLLRVVDARPTVADLREVPGAFAEQVAACGARAGVSGGFFLYSEPDILEPSRRGDPVGLWVSRGRVHTAPVLGRGALLVHRGGQIRLDRVDMDGVAIHGAGGAVHHVSTEYWYNRAIGETSPPGLPAVALVGDRVVARGIGPIAVPLAGGVLVHPAGAVPDFRVGEAVAFRLPMHLDVEEAMAGGPMLVEDGAVAIDKDREDFRGSAPPLTFSRDETFDQNLLPRLAMGLHDSGDLICAAVDGRNLRRAPGLTLRGTAGLMIAAGCVRALNLDGGSSKRMAVGGRVVDLTTTEVVMEHSALDAVREVRAAILLR